MSAGWWRLRWLFNRRVGLALLWTVPLLIAAVAVNMLGIRIAGGEGMPTEEPFFSVGTQSRPQPRPRMPSVQ